MSNIEVKFKENKTKDEIVSVRCSECNRDTKHRVVVSFDRNGSESDEDERWSVDWRDNYQVIQCQGCETTSFRHVSWFSEDVDPGTDDPGEKERLYPQRSATSINQKSFYNVPPNLRRIYVEIVDCYNRDSPTLCAAGLRAVVEGICAERGVTDGPVSERAKGGGTRIVRKNNLEGRIAGLQENGFLTESSTKTLHEHRFLGNSAVHELTRPSEVELRLAIEIVEHTLEQLYELPEKAEDLKRARARRKK
jgi:hypothetical protein